LEKRILPRRRASAIFTAAASVAAADVGRLAEIFSRARVVPVIGYGNPPSDTGERSSKVGV
jgi:hypothetical protein